jgi:hypothetical protein
MRTLEVFIMKFFTKFLIGAILFLAATQATTFCVMPQPPPHPSAATPHHPYRAAISWAARPWGWCRGWRSAWTWSPCACSWAALCSIWRRPSSGKCLREVCLPFCEEDGGPAGLGQALAVCIMPVFSHSRLAEASRRPACA